MGAKLALYWAGRPFQRIGGLSEMLAMAHELQTAECRGPGSVPTRRRAAADDRSHSLDGYDVGLTVHEVHEQPGKFPKLRTLRIRSAPIGDFTAGGRDRRRRHLEHLGD